MASSTPTTPRGAARFDINLMSAVRATHAALPSPIERRGAIVNFFSNAARMPAPANGPALRAAGAACTTGWRARTERRC